MTPEQLGAIAIAAIINGTNITLTLPIGEKWPDGWPRGELLSIGNIGKNYSFNPLKVIAHMQKLGKMKNGYGK